VEKKHTVLIVEDDVELRKLWRHVLAYEGFDVLEAGDGLDALTLVEQRPPDIVVLDLGLPMLGGISVQQEIAARAQTQRIPVLIVTASSDDLEHLDVPCVLRKPVTSDELIKMVRLCLAAGAPGVGS
jgi:two-component system, OmpR family, phosphate regulon response regulator PhoB